MALSTKIEPLDRDIQLILSETLSPQARSAALAKYAGEVIDEALVHNTRVLGHAPPYTVAVDGRVGAPLKSVQPEGVIAAEFEVVSNVLVWIDEQLQIHSPVKTGRYKKSHILFIDGVESGPLVVAGFDSAEFVNSQPYARKIERGLSPQAPDGVYQAVAVLAQRRFGNIARITFSYRAIFGGERNPAIIVRLRG